MRREGDVLLWSCVVFALITGALAFGDLYICDLITLPAGASGSEPATLVAECALATMPGAMLSWWMIVVHPRQPGAFTGGCAGLFTVVFAVLGVLLVAATSLHSQSGATASSPSLGTLVLALLMWIPVLANFAYQPWGWVTFLVGIVAGALYGVYIATYIRRHFSLSE